MTSPYTLPAGNVQIAFSGGRTSAYMLHRILEANGALPDRAVVCFQNTGREMPQTLNFVQEVGQRWGVPIVWLEYQPEPPLYRVVDHNSAARDGEPFEALIRKRKYLPNVKSRFCTAELKSRAAKRYFVSLGWKNWTSAVGIRADEPRRLKPEATKERWVPWHPLAADGVTKEVVAAFWARQPFDLQLPNVNGKSWLGNCDGCFLKSEQSLTSLIKGYPERGAWWERMEEVASGMAKRSGATFSMRYSRADLRNFLERQGDLALTTEGLLCQADDGECTG